MTANPGESPGDLATKMAVPDRQLDFFLLINGLEADAALQAGENYKIVAEEQ